LTLDSVEFTSNVQDAFYIGAHTKPLEIVLVGSNSFTSSNSGNLYGDTCGILGGTGNVTITGDGSLTATAGNTTSGNSYGIYCLGDLTVEGGLVDARGGTPGSGYASYGIRIDVLDTFTLNGGEVRASGGSFTGNNSTSVGLRDIGTPGIYGGKLIATGADVSGSDNRSFGIQSRGLNMEGGELEATGGTASYESYGIYSTYEIKVRAAINSAIFKGHNNAVFYNPADTLVVEPEYKYKADNYAGTDGMEVEEFADPEPALYIELRGTAWGQSETVVPEEPKPTPADLSHYYAPAPPSPPDVPLALIEFIDNEKVGEISLRFTSNMQKISSYVRINSNRTAQTENYIADKWGIDVLGSFETRQKGGWGDIVTLSVKLEDLGFKAENGTKLFVLIYDTKYKQWHKNEAVIENGEVVIVTENSGVFAIITK
jgi:hypothetical protein